MFVHTNRYKRSVNGELAKQYYNSRSVDLPHPTAATSELVQYAVAALKAVYVYGYEYQKTGVILFGMVPAGHQQTDLFTGGPDERLKKLSAVVDKINHRHGRDKVRLAGAGYDPFWHHKRQWMSPGYTTKWKNILRVK